MSLLQKFRLRWGLGGLLVGAAVAVPLVTARVRGADSTLEPMAWSTVFRTIEITWPAVAQLSTAELARRLQAGEQIVLLDARSRDEYLISHLPGAVWAESPARLRAAARAVPATQLIVLYCSVGVRSSKAAAMLMHDGGHTVANLRGSIFQWANEGRALEADGKPAVHVHPYNRAWGRLLAPRLRSASGS